MNKNWWKSFKNLELLCSVCDSFSESQIVDIHEFSHMEHGELVKTDNILLQWKIQLTIWSCYKSEKHRDEMYACFRCRRVFKNPHSLELSSVNRSERGTIGYICSLTFRHRNQVVQHMLQEHGRNIHIHRRMCEKGFSSEF